MKNDQEAPWFRVETRECGEQGGKEKEKKKKKKKEERKKEEEREIERERGRENSDGPLGVEREEDGKDDATRRGGTGTVRTVADWRPRARLRILGVMPVIRGSGAQ